MKKTFLFILSIVLLTSCNCKDKCDTATATPEKKDITLQLYSLREDIKNDYDGTIKKVGEMGFTSVEAAGYSDGKLYGKTPEEFKADLDKAGLKLISTHTSRALTDEELKSKDFTEALKWWDQCIDAHKAAGATYIVCPYLAVPNTIADLQTNCEYYNEIGKKCKEKGLLFGYHNHAHEFQKVEDQVMYDYMLEHTDPALVFFQMDVYWVVRGGQSPVDYFNKYAGRFPLLHIKDNKELGQSGMVGFDAIFKNTDKAGVKHLVVEVEKYNFTPLESVKMSLDYLLNCPLVKASYDK